MKCGAEADAPSGRRLHPAAALSALSSFCSSDRHATLPERSPTTTATTAGDQPTGPAHVLVTDSVGWWQSGSTTKLIYSFIFFSDSAAPGFCLTPPRLPFAITHSQTQVRRSGPGRNLKGQMVSQSTRLFLMCHCQPTNNKNQVPAAEAAAAGKIIEEEMSIVVINLVSVWRSLTNFSPNPYHPLRPLPPHLVRCRLRDKGSAL